MNLPDIDEQKLLDTILTGLNAEKSKEKKTVAAAAAYQMMRWIEAVKREAEKNQSSV